MFVLVWAHLLEFCLETVYTLAIVTLPYFCSILLVISVLFHALYFWYYSFNAISFFRFSVIAFYVTSFYTHIVPSVYEYTSSAMQFVLIVHMQFWIQFYRWLPSSSFLFLIVRERVSSLFLSLSFTLFDEPANMDSCKYMLFASMWSCVSVCSCDLWLRDYRLTIVIAILQLQIEFHKFIESTEWRRDAKRGMKHFSLAGFQ